jgi:hypothetical protein
MITRVPIGTIIVLCWLTLPSVAGELQRELDAGVVGIAVIGGHRISGPLKVQISHSSIRINGLKVYPAVKRDRPYRPAVNADRLKEAQANHVLRARINQDIARLRQTGLRGRALAAAVAREYAASSAVDSSWVTSDRTIMIKWRASRYPEEFILTDSPPRKTQDTLLELGSDFAKQLRRGDMLLFGDGYSVTVPRRRVPETLQLLDQARLGNARALNSRLGKSGIGRDALFPQPLDSLKSLP